MKLRYKDGRIYDDGSCKVYNCSNDVDMGLLCNSINADINDLKTHCNKFIVQKESIERILKM